VRPTAQTMTINGGLALELIGRNLFARIEGAPAPEAGEPASDWLRRALPAVGARTVRHQGNYRYMWTIGDRAARRRTPIALAALPYPTTVDGTR